MFKIYRLKDKNKWNKEVQTYDDWDIYFLNEYAASFKIHGDGEPILILYKDKNVKFCYVMMINDISDSPNFCGFLPGNKYYDMETPYGYGGILLKGKITNESELKFKKKLFRFCKRKNIISQFIRFHPLLGNYKYLNQTFEKKYMRDTIYVDLTDESNILSNMDKKNRNLIRKAKKSNIFIKTSSIEEFDDFLNMYNMTMERNNADKYYIFDKSYFDSLKEMKDNALIFYAYKDDHPISGAIVYYNQKYMHYHLSGCTDEARELCANNLLLYEISLWGSRKGISYFHLGGGMSDGDSLFSFKKQFNKKGMLPFYIGRTIFNKNVYNQLLDIRKNNDNNFDVENSNMIQYRR